MKLSLLSEGRPIKIGLTPTANSKISQNAFTLAYDNPDYTVLKYLWLKEFKKENENLRETYLGGYYLKDTIYVWSRSDSKHEEAAKVVGKNGFCFYIIWDLSVGLTVIAANWSNTRSQVDNGLINKVREQLSEPLKMATMEIIQEFKEAGEGDKIGIKNFSIARTENLSNENKIIIVKSLMKNLGLGLGDLSNPDNAQSLLDAIDDNLYDSQEFIDVISDLYVGAGYKIPTHA